MLHQSRTEIISSQPALIRCRECRGRHCAATPLVVKHGINVQNDRLIAAFSFRTQNRTHNFVRGGNNKDSARVFVGCGAH